MKINNGLFCLALVSFLFFVLIEPAIASSVNLYDNADAVVQSSYPSNNYGSGTTLAVGANPSGNEQWSYFSFEKPTSKIASGATISNAMCNFRIPGSSFNSGLDVKLCGFTSSWSESSITWNNKPSCSGYESKRSWSSGSPQGFYDWNCTNAVRNAYNNDQTVEIVLYPYITGGNSYVNYININDRASGNTLWPYIVVDYTVPVQPCQCGDGTLCNQCSTYYQGKYCDSSKTLVNKCGTCGCASGQTCDTSTQICANSSCTQNCDLLDGKYCNGNSVDYRDYYCSGTSCTFTVKNTTACTYTCQSGSCYDPNVKPDTPVLLTPANNTVFTNTLTPTFDWKDVGYASYYIFTIFDLNENPLHNSNPIISNYTLPANIVSYGNSYTWRVWAYSNISNKTSDQSELRYFSTSGKNNASCVSTTIPDSLTIGQKATVSVTMKNAGTNTWTAAKNYKLGSQTPQDNTVWGLGRVLILDSSTVSNEGTYTFTFDITAPSTAGNYSCNWKMVQELVEWFGGTCTKTVQVKTAAPGPSLISPANNSYFSNTSVLLKWNAATNATVYDVNVYNANGSIFSQSSTSLTQSNVTGLVNGKTYYWKVRACSTSCSQWSQAWYFNVTFTGTTLVSPADNGIVNTATPTLSWDPISGATNYCVKVYEGSAVIFTNCTANTSLTIPAGKLSDNKVYQWKVNANGGDYSSPWSFKYINLTATVVVSSGNQTVNNWAALAARNVMNRMLMKFPDDRSSNLNITIINIIFSKRTDYCDGYDIPCIGTGFSVKGNTLNLTVYYHNISGPNYPDIKSGNDLTNELRILFAHELGHAALYNKNIIVAGTSAYWNDGIIDWAAKYVTSDFGTLSPSEKIFIEKALSNRSIINQLNNPIGNGYNSTPMWTRGAEVSFLYYAKANNMFSNLSTLGDTITSLASFASSSQYATSVESWKDTFGCNTNSDCLTGSVCSAKRCVSGECNLNSECSGKVCANHWCVSCMQNSDCGADGYVKHCHAEDPRYVFTGYAKHECMNAGTKESYCVTSSNGAPDSAGECPLMTYVCKDGGCVPPYQSDIPCYPGGFICNGSMRGYQAPNCSFTPVENCSGGYCVGYTVGASNPTSAFCTTSGERQYLDCMASRGVEVVLQTTAEQGVYSLTNADINLDQSGSEIERDLEAVLVDGTLVICTPSVTVPGAQFLIPPCIALAGSVTLNEISFAHDDCKAKDPVNPKIQLIGLGLEVYKRSVSPVHQISYAVDLSADAANLTWYSVKQDMRDLLYNPAWGTNREDLFRRAMDGDPDATAFVSTCRPEFGYSYDCEPLKPSDRLTWGEGNAAMMNLMNHSEVNIYPSQWYVIQKDNLSASASLPFRLTVTDLSFNNSNSIPVANQSLTEDYRQYMLGADGNREGMMFVRDSMLFVVPPFTIPSSATITVADARQDAPAVPQDLQLVGRVYSLNSQATLKPIIIVGKYSPSDVSGSESIDIYYYNTLDSSWKPLGARQDAQKGTLVAYANKTTFYAMLKKSGQTANCSTEDYDEPVKLYCSAGDIKQLTRQHLFGYISGNCSENKIVDKEILVESCSSHNYDNKQDYCNGDDLMQRIIPHVYSCKMTSSVPICEENSNAPHAYVIGIVTCDSGCVDNACRIGVKLVKEEDKRDAQTKFKEGSR